MLHFEPKPPTPARYMKTIRVTKELDDKLKQLAQETGYSENMVVCKLIEAATLKGMEANDGAVQP